MKAETVKGLFLAGVATIGVLMLILFLSIPAGKHDILRFISGFLAYGILFPIVIVALVMFLEKVGKKKPSGSERESGKEKEDK